MNAAGSVQKANHISMYLSQKCGATLKVKTLRLDAVGFFSVTTVVRKYRDDNEGQFYSCKCTRQLNAWAEKAARELKNVTPIIKYNKKY